MTLPRFAFPVVRDNEFCGLLELVPEARASPSEACGVGHLLDLGRSTAERFVASVFGSFRPRISVEKHGEVSLDGTSVQGNSYGLALVLATVACHWRMSSLLRDFARSGEMIVASGAVEGGRDFPVTSADFAVKLDWFLGRLGDHRCRLLIAPASNVAIALHLNGDTAATTGHPIPPVVVLDANCLPRRLELRQDARAIICCDDTTGLSELLTALYHKNGLPAVSSVPSAASGRWIPFYSGLLRLLWRNDLTDASVDGLARECAYRSNRTLTTVDLERLSNESFQRARFFR